MTRGSLVLELAASGEKAEIWGRSLPIVELHECDGYDIYFISYISHSSVICSNNLGITDSRESEKSADIIYILQPSNKYIITYNLPCIKGTQEGRIP